MDQPGRGIAACRRCPAGSSSAGPPERSRFRRSPRSWPPAARTHGSKDPARATGTDELYEIATPDNPVTLPIHDDLPPIEDGLEPEQGTTVQLYQ